MTRLLVIILILAILGDIAGLYFWYKSVKLQRQLAATNNSLEKLTDILDGFYSKRLVFLHHSVGQSILYYGGLADSLRGMGIMVKGATYGDSIGDKTDICDWTPKFKTSMDQILRFKAHPNMYYSDGRNNDVIMFKSCYPNSDLTSDGSGPGDPESAVRTVANYKATFNALQEEFKKYPDKLFIYMTIPPLVPKATTPENAKRAREIDRWVVNEFTAKYRRETGLSNFAVFDLFDVLADNDNYLKEEFRLGRPDDSHPNAQGARVAAQKFLEFFRPVWENWLSRPTPKETSAAI